MAHCLRLHKSYIFAWSNLFIPKSLWVGENTSRELKPAYIYTYHSEMSNDARAISSFGIHLMYFMVVCMQKTYQSLIPCVCFTYSNHSHRVSIELFWCLYISEEKILYWLVVTNRTNRWDWALSTVVNIEVCFTNYGVGKHGIPHGGLALGSYRSGEFLCIFQLKIIPFFSSFRSLTYSLISAGYII